MNNDRNETLISTTFVLCIIIWAFALLSFRHIRNIEKDIEEIKQEVIMHDTICLEPATDTICFDEINN